jgi:uncharacterized protein (TIGR03067 family)
MKKMNGTWVPVSGELGGNKLPAEQLKTIKLEIKGEQYTVTVGDKVDKGTVKMDAAKKPKEIDITGTDGPNKGKTMLAIYELKGDTLRVCYDLGGKARPTEFASKANTLQFLVSYQREKK